MNNIPSFSDITNFIYEFAEDMAFGYLDDPTITFNHIEDSVKFEDNTKIIDAAFNIKWSPRESAMVTKISKSPETEIMLQTLPRGFLYSKNPTLDIFTGNHFSITLLNHTNHSACFNKFGKFFLDGFFALPEYQNSHMILYAFKDHPDCIFMEKKYGTDGKKTYKHLIQLRKEEKGFVIETHYAEHEYIYNFNTKLSIAEKINLYSEESYNKIKKQKGKVFTLLLLNKNSNELYFSENNVTKDIIFCIYCIYENLLNLEFHNLQPKDADTVL